MQTNSKNAFTFIFLTILIDCIGIGIIILVMPALISDLADVNTNEAT